MYLKDLFDELGHSLQVNRMQAWVENVQEVYSDGCRFLKLDIRDQSNSKCAVVNFEFGEIRHYYNNLNHKIGYGRVRYEGKIYRATLYLYVLHDNKRLGEIVITDISRGNT